MVVAAAAEATAAVSSGDVAAAMGRDCFFFQLHIIKVDLVDMICAHLLCLLKI